MYEPPAWQQITTWKGRREVAPRKDEAQARWKPEREEEEEEQEEEEEEEEEETKTEP